jgi:hypothetical protein
MRVGLAKRRHDREYLAQAHATREGALGSPLNGGSVGHRIGERDAQFDDVRTTLDQGMHERHREFGRGITCRDEGNQRATVAALELLEYRLDS